MHFWYRKKPHLTAHLLAPLAWVYGRVIKRRRMYIEKRRTPAPLPVIVVGNITVGGTGKTPMVIWLADYLQQQGWRVGIVSRGYKGQQSQFPHCVDVNQDTAKQVGDEPYLMAQKTQRPVVIDPNRLNAVKYLAEHTDCNMVISDDGMQHYRMSRVMEIAIIDGMRQFGNGKLLPAGPLREPIHRLREIELVVSNNAKIDVAPHTMFFKPTALQPVNQQGKSMALSTLKGETIHAITGIGNPERFFHTLASLGAHVKQHIFADHHRFAPHEFRFTHDDDIVIMTEKDAVKCQAFAKPNWYYLPITVEFDDQFITALKAQLALLNGLQ